MSWKTLGGLFKVTNSGNQIKTERISGKNKNHSHEIVKVDKNSGRVKEIYKGENSPRKKK